MPEAILAGGAYHLSKMTIISQVFAYDDDQATSNPSRKPVDWTRTIANLTVYNPSTQKVEIEALGVRTLIDGTRSLTIDGTTQFSIAPIGLDPSSYRITHTGGAAPGFRTNRNLALASVALTVTLNANLSLTIAASSGTPFAAVAAGDVVFLPGVSTGDSASPFNALNEGYWTAISANNLSVTLVRDPSGVFSGISESVTPSSNSQLQAFGAAGVQVGDTVELLAGFSVTSLRAYEITGVNPEWIEIVSTAAIGSESGVAPTAAGLVVYTSAKRYLFIEVDQECIVRFNGDTGSSNTISPWIPGDDRFPAQASKSGNVWKLQLVNRSTVPMKALVITAE